VHEQSWVDFDRRYSPFIRGYAKRLGVRGQDVEALVAAVITGFFSAVPKFVYDPTIGRFRGYVAWATRHAAAGLTAKSDRAEALESYEPAAPEDMGAIAVWDRIAPSRAIEQVRPNVEERGFRAFELYVIRGVPAEEVSREVGVSIDAVHAAKSHVGKRVREVFEQMREED
jgi:RNA polymerase sigma-70 factor, ECF subfamily